MKLSDASAIKVGVLAVAAIYCGSTLAWGGAALSPLRSVSTTSQIPSGSGTIGGTQLGRAVKDLHHIAYDTTQLVVSLNNWGLGGFSNSNAFTVPEMWITVSGQGSGYAVKWSGATNATVPAGAVDYQSDIITPENLGFSGFIPAGTALYIGYRAEVSTAGFFMPASGTDRNPTSNSSIAYTPGTTVISNLQGSAAMSWTGGVTATGDATQPPILLLGKFKGGDKPVFMAIGDSIVVGANSANGAGFFFQSLFANYATRTNPLPAIQIARSGSNANEWFDGVTFPGQPARLATICKYANVAVERYGINSIAGGYAGVLSSRQTIWSIFRTNAVVSGGNTPKILALPLTPYTTSTDAWATYANQAPTTGAGGVGGNLDLLSQGITAIVGQANGPDWYFDNTAGVRGTGSDYWKWAPSASSDGLHPSTAPHATMGTALRPVLESIT